MQCRICLATGVDLYSVFHIEKDVSYATMIMSVAAVKIEETCNNLICYVCIENLRYLYEFKNLIERSDFQLNHHIKRLTFNNIHDLIVTACNNGEITTTNGLEHLPAEDPNSEVINVNELNIMSYNDLVIKTVGINNENTVTEPVQEINHNILNDNFQQLESEVYVHKEIEETTPAINDVVHNIDNLNSAMMIYNLNELNIISYNDLVIKKVKVNNEEEIKEPEINHYMSNDDAKLGYPGTDRLDVLEKNSNLKKTTPKRKKKHKNKKKCKLKINLTGKLQVKTNVCIKPVFLADLRILSCRKGMKRKKKLKDSKINQQDHKKRDMCPYCGKLVIVLKKHILIHTAERIYKCSECEHRYYTEKELIRHIKTHTSPIEFRCDHCVAVFYQKASLVKHMITHQNNKVYTCNTCNKSFKWLSGLNRHVLTHGGKSVICDVCQMMFLSKNNLTNHMRVHTKERPYSCEICNQTYSYKRDFNRHCFNKHGVFLKHRSVNMINEEVLEKEKVIMDQIMSHVQNFLNDGQPLSSTLNPFTGPQAARAFELAVKQLQDNNQIPVDPVVFYE